MLQPVLVDISAISGYKCHFMKSDHFVIKKCSPQKTSNKIFFIESFHCLLTRYNVHYVLHQSKHLSQIVASPQKYHDDHKNKVAAATIQ